MNIAKLDRDKINEKCISSLRDFASDMSTLQTAREQALKAYMCQPYGNEMEGRSQVVMSDVFNTIESILPSLMRIFTGSVDVVQVSGQGEGDDDKAKLMGELLNYQSRKCFNSFIVFYDWFKDALMYKMGAVKYYWEKKKTYKHKEFKGLTEEELNVYKSMPNFTITKETANDDGTYDISGKLTRETSQPMVEVLPPEEFIFNVRDKEIRTCFHKKRVHRQTLRKYGVKDTDVADTITEMSGDNLENERFRDLGGVNFLVDENDENFVYIYEAYFDEYEDGEPVPMKAVIMGSKVIDLEENKYGKPPFEDISAIRLTHRAVGRSFYDLAGEVQKLKTALVRYILDNIYYQNNAQVIVNPYKINMDDIFDQNMPGGKIRTLDINTPVGDAYMPVPVAPLSPQAFNFLEYADGSILENRTGVTKYNQGLDSQSLNKTAHGISQIFTASMQRIELIARLFAETGIKRLYEDLAQMNLDFMDRPTSIKVNEKWKTIRPEDIDGQYDINIDVGIGTGTKEAIVQQLMTMLDLYMKGLVEKGIATPENVTEMIKAIWENMGFKNATKFIGQAEDAAPKPPDPMAEAQKDMSLRMGVLAIAKAEEEIIEVRTKAMLNLANAESKEVGTQLDNYSQTLDEIKTFMFKGGNSGTNGPATQEAGEVIEGSGTITGGAADQGQPNSAGVFPQG